MKRRTLPKTTRGMFTIDSEELWDMLWDQYETEDFVELIRRFDEGAQSWEVTIRLFNFFAEIVLKNHSEILEDILDDEGVEYQTPTEEEKYPQYSPYTLLANIRKLYIQVAMLQPPAEDEYEAIEHDILRKGK